VNEWWVQLFAGSGYRGVSRAGTQQELADAKTREGQERGPKVSNGCLAKPLSAEVGDKGWGYHGTIASPQHLVETVAYPTKIGIRFGTGTDK